MPPWLRRLLRWAGGVAYLGALGLLAVVAAYFSFNLFVRSGVTAVPDMVGLEEQEASDRIADSGLHFQHVNDADDYDDAVPAGHVLSLKPAPRTLVKRGSAVIVGLSLGPQVIQVPEIVGQTTQAAQVTLAAAGLSLGRIVHVFSASAAGTVVQQRPPAGAAAPPNAAVDLLVSRQNSAETYLMPDLVYRRYEDARRFFERRNFKVGSVKFEVYEGIPEGVILRQFPLAGHPLRRQDSITLVVSTTTEGRSRT
jgi:serine/threonine-protein kinase